MERAPKGLGTAQEIFDFFDDVFPAEDPFWNVIVGDPGPDDLFDFAVYFRGAMTLHELRLTVGDEDFFRDPAPMGRPPRPAATSPPTSSSPSPSASPAEQLDELFETWLFTPEKPDLDELAAVAPDATLREFSPSAPLREPVDHRRAKH